MSIFKNKLATFVLALFCIVPFSLAFVGCGDPDKANQEKAANTYNAVVEQLNAMSNNFMVDITGAYSCGIMGADKKEGTTKIRLQFADGNTYFKIPATKQGEEDTELLVVNGIAYTPDGQGAYEMYSYLNKDKEELFAPMVNYVIVNEFSQFVEFANLLNDKVLSVETQGDVTTLTATLDLGSLLNKIVANIETNHSQQILAFVNQFLKDIYNESMTVDSLVSGFTNTYTTQTTFGQLFEYLNSKLGLNLTQNVTLMFDAMYEMGQSDLDGTAFMQTTIHSVLQEQKQESPEEYAWYDGTGSSIKTYIMGELTDKELTLDALLGKTSDEVTALLTVLKAYTLDEAKLVWSVSMDENNTITSMDLSTSIKISTEVESTKVYLLDLEASLDMTFSQIGTTSVNMPGSASYADVEMQLDLDTSNTQIVIQLNDYAQLADDLTMKGFMNGSEAEITVATYDKTTKTLKINSAWAIEQLEASNELYLEFGDNGEGSALYYFNISQTPQQIIE